MNLEDIAMDAMKNYEFWCTSPYFDEATKAELLAIKDDEKEITERFYRELEFGTGGLRGILGAGTNRMNIYTVRKATQGLANFFIKEHAQEKGVAISFDSRHMSPEFAKETHPSSKVYLGSAATVTASAIAGKIALPSEI